MAKRLTKTERVRWELLCLMPRSPCAVPIEMVLTDLGITRLEFGDGRTWMRDELGVKTLLSKGNREVAVDQNSWSIAQKLGDAYVDEHEPSWSKPC